MSYIYKLKKDFDLEKLKEIGFELLPKELYGDKNNHTIYYKLEPQPIDGHCVNNLIGFYVNKANDICTDRIIRRAHANMGIKYKWSEGKYKLIVTPTLQEMFSMWRCEIDIENNDVYFTISDGNIAAYLDAELVLEKYCKETIELLVLNDIIEKVEA